LASVSGWVRAVHVEPVGVLAGVGLAAIRVLHRDDPHQRVVQDLPRGAIIAVGQLIQDPELRVGRALLAAVHVAHQPHDGRCAAGDVGRLLVAGGRITQRARRLLDPRQPLRGDVLRLSHQRVPDRPPLPGRAQRAADHTRARGVHGIHVGIRFGGSDLPGAQREPEHPLGGGHLAPKARRRLHRVAGRHPDRGHRTRGPRHRKREEHSGDGGEQGSAPHRASFTRAGQPAPRPRPDLLPKKRRRPNARYTTFAGHDPPGTAGTPGVSIASHRVCRST